MRGSGDGDQSRRSRGSQVYHYLAFYLSDGTGCDVDIPRLDPGASRTLSCAVQFSSNYPSGNGPRPSADRSAESDRQAAVSSNAAGDTYRIDRLASGRVAQPPVPS